MTKRINKDVEMLSVSDVVTLEAVAAKFKGWAASNVLCGELTPITTLQLPPSNTAEFFVGIKFKRPVSLTSNIKDTSPSQGRFFRLEYVRPQEVNGGDATFFGPFENNLDGQTSYEIMEPSI